ncbi:hypothetical protein JOL62DRAFT_302845 [Phyllosticta paracitricarpa]|uniref:Uncharacterized protein n=1 Tax=Phyllosticta paracitricarpa TaxID=2016321 RepID=A0ABR1NGU5_9PEZI
MRIVQRGARRHDRRDRLMLTSRSALDSSPRHSRSTSKTSPDSQEFFQCETRAARPGPDGDLMTGNAGPSRAEPRPSVLPSSLCLSTQHQLSTVNRQPGLDRGSKPCSAVPVLYLHVWSLGRPSSAPDCFMGGLTTTGNSGMAAHCRESQDFLLRIYLQMKPSRVYLTMDSPFTQTSRCRPCKRPIGCDRTRSPFPDCNQSPVTSTRPSRTDLARSLSACHPQTRQQAFGRPKRTNFQKHKDIMLPAASSLHMRPARHPHARLPKSALAPAPHSAKSIRSRANPQCRPSPWS